MESVILKVAETRNREKTGTKEGNKMLRKVWNTLRHGDSKTKFFLYSVMGLCVAGMILFVTAIVQQSLLPGLAAVAVTIIAAAMMKDAVLVVKNGGMSGKEKHSVKAAKREKHQKELPDTVADLPLGELEEFGEQQGKKKKKAERKEAQAEKERLEREQEDEKEFGDNALGAMTEEKLKNLLLRYKVKQEHVPVIIDLCIPERVRQAPGFAWVDAGMLKILLIERKTRMIERPLSALQVMEVEKGIAVKASAEYTELRDTDLMKRVFTPYLPRYQKKEIGGRTVLLKNLYVLDEEIKFTSASVNELKKLFSFRIEIADRRFQEMDLSPYYKKIYVDSFLWRDGILTLQEYKAQIEQVIDSLADPAVPYGEFETTISAMINSGLLPAEYRNYANTKREEKERDAEEKKGKRKGKKR